MPTLENTLLYLAVKNRPERSQFEDGLVLDGIDVTTFASAAALWEAFQHRQARLVVTERRFDDDFDGLALTRAIRENFRLPHTYICMVSKLSHLNEIREGLAAGVDDYLVKPHNPFQIRTRVLVGLRWLTYIDSVLASLPPERARPKSS